MLIQMRRGSSTEFSSVLTLAYSLEHSLPWSYDQGIIVEAGRPTFFHGGSTPFSRPLDARSLGRRKAAVYVSHHTHVVNQYRDGVAYIRLRNPIDQCRSLVVLLEQNGTPREECEHQAIEYFRTFAMGVPGERNGTKIHVAVAERYFEDRAAQLTECSQALGLKVSERSVSDALGLYDSIKEKSMSTVTETSPRGSYRSRYSELSDEAKRDIKIISSASVFGAWYPNLLDEV